MLWETAASLVSALCRREISSREVLDGYLERVDPALNAVITLDVERARAEAAAADEAAARGEVLGPLAFTRDGKMMAVTDANARTYVWRLPRLPPAGWLRTARQ